MPLRQREKTETDRDRCKACAQLYREPKGLTSPDDGRYRLDAVLGTTHRPQNSRHCTMNPRAVLFENAARDGSY
jgi:hypothetical protein